MRNPLSLMFNTGNREKESTIITAIATQSQVEPAAVERVLKASYQITENYSAELKENQEDLYNTMMAQNQINQKELAQLRSGLNQVNNKQKITNAHLSDMQELINHKAEKAAKGTDQLDLDEIMFNNLTMDEIFKREEKRISRSKEYKKQLAVFKRRIWHLIKLHMNDIYGTSRSKRKEDFQDYMFSEMQDYVKSLSVFEVRRKDNY